MAKVNIMNQIAQGVEYLHKKNVIHRDIKPANILIRDNNPIVAKLTDFDFCKFFEETYDTSLVSTNVSKLLNSTFEMLREKFNTTEMWIYTHWD